MAHGRGVVAAHDAQFVHGPLQFHVASGNSRFEAVAQTRKQPRDVAGGHVECIDRQLELIERITQRMQQLFVVGAARLQLPDRRTEMGADAVIHVAQNARALGGARLLARRLGQLPVGLRQLGFLLRDPRRQVGRELAQLGVGSAKALDHDICQGEAERRRGIAQPGLPTVSVAKPEEHQVANARRGVQHSCQGDGSMHARGAGLDRGPAKANREQAKQRGHRAIPERQRHGPSQPCREDHADGCEAGEQPHAAGQR